MPEEATEISPELRELVIAGREFLYDDAPGARDSFDKALEAFAEAVPWADQP